MCIRKFNQLLNHKQGIIRSFSRAAPYYDRYASFQRSCGEHLCALLGTVTGSLLLDAGCGTGWFSRYWKNKNKQVIALDLSLDMLSYARKQGNTGAYLVGDIEKLPLVTSSMDIVFSNLAIQWCDVLPRAIAECYRVLRPGGVIALSTLANGSLIELDHTWQKIDNNKHINRFLSQSTIAEAFNPYRHRLYTELKTLYYPRLIDLLREIKGVGAGYLRGGRQSGLIGRSRIHALEEYWPHHADGLPLSYQVIYGVLYRDYD